jgi:hypothetical protein
VRPKRQRLSGGLGQILTTSIEQQMCRNIKPTQGTGYRLICPPFRINCLLDNRSLDVKLAHASVLLRGWMTLGRNLAWYLAVRGYFFIFITSFTLVADGSIRRYWIIGGTKALVS